MLADTAVTQTSAVLALRRANPGDDLFSDLLGAERAGAPLPEEDLRGYGVNYLLGGTETTRNLLGQSLRVLAAAPGDPAALVAPDVVLGAADDLAALRAFAARREPTHAA